MCGLWRLQRGNAQEGTAHILGSFKSPTESDSYPVGHIIRTVRKHRPGHWWRWILLLLWPKSFSDPFCYCLPRPPPCGHWRGQNLAQPFVKKFRVNFPFESVHGLTAQYSVFLLHIVALQSLYFWTVVKKSFYVDAYISIQPCGLVTVILLCCSSITSSDQNCL